MGLSRRKFVTGHAAVAGAGALAPTGGVLAQPRRRTIVKTATATRTGEYIYLKFRIPRGVNRVGVGLTKNNPETKVGVGLYDWRGAGYQSPGFRGIYGEESSRFFVASGSASRSFTPGPIRRGRWTVVVPVFRAAGPTDVSRRAARRRRARSRTRCWTTTRAWRSGRACPAGGARSCSRATTTSAPAR